MEKELMKTLSEHGRLGIAQQFDLRFCVFQ